MVGGVRIYTRVIFEHYDFTWNCCSNALTKSLQSQETLPFNDLWISWDRIKGERCPCTDRRHASVSSQCVPFESWLLEEVLRVPTSLPLTLHHEDNRSFLHGTLIVNVVSDILYSICASCAGWTRGTSLITFVLCHAGVIHKTQSNILALSETWPSPTLSGWKEDKWPVNFCIWYFSVWRSPNEYAWNNGTFWKEKLMVRAIMHLRFSTHFVTAFMAYHRYRHLLLESGGFCPVSFTVVMQQRWIILFVEQNRPCPQSTSIRRRPVAYHFER